LSGFSARSWLWEKRGVFSRAGVVLSRAASSQSRVSRAAGFAGWGVLS
jgi:hypothetical protein